MLYSSTIQRRLFKLSRNWRGVFILMLILTAGCFITPFDLQTLDEMTDKAVPAKIRFNKDLGIEEPVGK